MGLFTLLLPGHYTSSTEHSSAGFSLLCEAAEDDYREREEKRFVINCRKVMAYTVIILINMALCAFVGVCHDSHLFTNTVTTADKS